MHAAVFTGHKGKPGQRIRGGQGGQHLQQPGPQSQTNDWASSASAKQITAWITKSNTLEELTDRAEQCSPLNPVQLSAALMRAVKLARRQKGQAQIHSAERPGGGGRRNRSDHSINLHDERGQSLGAVDTYLNDEDEQALAALIAGRYTKRAAGRCQIIRKSRGEIRFARMCPSLGLLNARLASDSTPTLTTCQRVPSASGRWSLHAHYTQPTL